MYWSYSTSLPPGRGEERGAGGDGLGASVDKQGFRVRGSVGGHLIIDAAKVGFDPYGRRGISRDCWKC